MPTSSHATMVREITAAGDRERTGAIDVEWGGSRASLFFMFGHPSHAVFTSADGRSLAGDDALNALAHELPSAFRVAPWRRAMVTEDTLHVTAGELLALFPDPPAGGGQEPAQPAPDGPGPVSFEWGGATAPPVPAAPGFPLLPLGPALWSDEVANAGGLEALLPRLPDCLLVLTAPEHDAAVLVSGGVVVDAISFAGGRRFVGDEARAALLSATTGTITAHRLDDHRLVVTLPLLWRGARVSQALPTAWFHAAGLVADALAAGSTCALMVEASTPGVALFDHGGLVAVYSADQRNPTTSLTLLDSLLQQPGARVTLAGDPLPAVEAVAAAPAEPAVDATASVAPGAVPEAADVAPLEADGAPLEAADVAALEAADAAPADAAAAGADPPAAAPELEPAAEREVPPAVAAAGADEIDGDAASEAAPAMFSIAAPRGDVAPSWREADEPIPPLPEFVAPRLDVDIDALRAELDGIAVQWLTADDAAEPAAAIAATRPGVADFVATIAAIGQMDIPGHESAVVRAMAREMHYRASEVLCGV